MKTALEGMLTSSEVADLIGCSQDTVARARDDGELEGFRLTDNGWCYYEPRSVRAWIEKRRKKNFHDGNGKGSTQRSRGRGGRRG